MVMSHRCSWEEVPPGIRPVAKARLFYDGGLSEFYSGDTLFLGLS